MKKTTQGAIEMLQELKRGYQELLHLRARVAKLEKTSRHHIGAPKRDRLAKQTAKPTRKRGK